MRISGYLPGWRRGEGAGDGGCSAGDQARAPRTGRQVGPARGIVYGARREIEQLAAGHVGRRGAMIGTMGSVAGADAAVGGAAGPGAGSVVARPRLFGRLAGTGPGERGVGAAEQRQDGVRRPQRVRRVLPRPPEELMQHLTVPATLASWLDETLGTPAQLAEASV